MHCKGVGQDQRSAALARARVHGNGNDPAERQPADMRAFDTQRIHARENRRREIVARPPRRAVAFPIARIIERDCPPHHPEMV